MQWLGQGHCGGRLVHAKITGVSSDTARVCRTASITTTPLAHTPLASSGKRTTATAKNGRRAIAHKPRRLCGRVREAVWRNRGSSPLCGNSGRSLLETGTCPSIRARTPETALPVHTCLHTYTHIQTLFNTSFSHLPATLFSVPLTGACLEASAKKKEKVIHSGLDWTS